MEVGDHLMQVNIHFRKYGVNKTEVSFHYWKSGSD